MSYFDGFRITSPYGWRDSPIRGGREFHTGVDLVKSHRAPILAFVEGDVIHARDGLAGSGFGGYGITVAVRDKYGCLHVYAHLDSVSVSVGQYVSRGQEVGKQGNTGQSTGSHLHYEVRKTSNPSYGWIADRANNCYEPLEYLREYYAKEAELTMSKRFNDVPENHWARASIEKAAEAGVISGVSADTFGVGQPVTREQLAVIFDRIGVLDEELAKKKRKEGDK